MSLENGLGTMHAMFGASVLNGEMSKTKAVLLVSLSGLAAVITALQLHGWRMFLALSLIAIGLTIGFVQWSRKP